MFSICPPPNDPSTRARLADQDRDRRHRTNVVVVLMVIGPKFQASCYRYAATNTCRKAVNPFADMYSVFDAS